MNQIHTETGTQNLAYKHQSMTAESSHLGITKPVFLSLLLDTQMRHLHLVYNGRKASYGFTQTREGRKGEVPCQVILALQLQ